MTIDQIISNNIKAIAISMIEKSKSGHPGGPMGGSDFMHILYSEFLKFDPENPQWIYRDRFFLDPGHLSALIYSQLYLLGYYKKSDIESFRQWGSVTPGHPEKDVNRGIENTSGPLGQGHAMGIGAAIAAKFLDSRFSNIFSHKIYSYISDGGIQEEISQGVGRIAGHLGLNNFIMFFDSNDIQLSTSTSEVSSEDTEKKYQAWGWNVITIDGHDHNQIRAALKKSISEKERPSLIIGKTIIGKGCVTEDMKKYEGHCELHGKPISATAADYQKTMINLGADPNQAFEIFEKTSQYYHQVLKKKKKEVLSRNEEIEKWKKQNPKLSQKVTDFFESKMPPIDFETILHKPNISTREASHNVLKHLSSRLENIIVSSADLSNSDKTDGFLKNQQALKKGDFSGGFLHAGVSELSMAAIANGIALHGGVLVAVGTFFVFSDYMKPAIRMSAIQELPVKYIWTHDSFRVGEDGGTHQPVEQEAQIRLLEKLKNHSGKNSMLVLRPADSGETSVAWKMALENTSTPTGIILSRQAVPDLPLSYKQALQSQKGAYLVQKSSNPDIILLANGSEVGILMESASILSKRGIQSNVVSIISEGLFLEQSKAYQENILPKDIRKFGLTASLPITFEALLGNNDMNMVFGLNHFGHSAPASVLDQKFGFSAENISDKIEAFLNTHS